MPKNKTGTRIESILRLFEIKNRVLSDYTDYELINEKIDYNNVNKLLEKERKKSMELLKKAIED